MIELRITDVDLQKIIGNLLRKRLRKAGFAMGMSEAEEPTAFLLPINLDLAGHVTVVHSPEEGCFVFTQADGKIERIIVDINEDCGDAIANRADPR